MVRYYSHEAADLQPALEMLKCQNMGDHGVCVNPVWPKVFIVRIL